MKQLTILIVLSRFTEIVVESLEDKKKVFKNYNIENNIENIQYSILFSILFSIL